MNLAKISPDGQITIPVEIRRLLGLKSGDNISAYALFKAQQAFEGVAEKLGIKDEDDVQALVNAVRYV